MKINWGTGIVLGMTGFIGFIMFFVVQMLGSKDFDHDLVTEDYYGAELHYQQDINAEENAFGLSEKVKVERSDNGWLITFPKEVKAEDIVGKVTLYRPSDKKLDFTVSLTKMQANQVLVQADKLLAGRWNMNIAWTSNNKDYLVRKELSW
ncbi:cytochrome C oxidase Cbb3 [Christiangramia fulva]|uniref:Cytochrome C oxidase Cbb3 n=1 Tax=Christiangramia fulva TaxID=2126553 RepID=A0A2R3ZAQ0_9FLAO|nr:cytochrome C oxidase Cbb3 [Christiangramia fulva]